MTHSLSVIRLYYMMHQFGVTRHGAGQNSWALVAPPCLMPCVVELDSAKVRGAVDLGIVGAPVAVVMMPLLCRNLHTDRPVLHSCTHQTYQTCLVSLCFLKVHDSYPLFEQVLSLLSA